MAYGFYYIKPDYYIDFGSFSNESKRLKLSINFLVFVD